MQGMVIRLIMTFLVSIKKKLPLQKYQDIFAEKVVDQLVKKAEGNFLYIKFVMDAIAEGKIGFSEEEINRIPSGLVSMYNSFFNSMLSRYGKVNWDTFYIPVIRCLLISFEGLDSTQLSFFTVIEDKFAIDLSIRADTCRKNFSSYAYLPFLEYPCELPLKRF
jgi:hypothetical protein